MGNEKAAANSAHEITPLSTRSCSTNGDEDLPEGCELAPRLDKIVKSRGQQQHAQNTRKLRKRKWRVSKQFSCPQKIIARFAYPAESRPSTSHHSTPTETAAPTISSPHGLKSLPKPFSVFTQALRCVSSYMRPYINLSFSSFRNAILESSDVNTQHKTRAHVEDERKKSRGKERHEKVVRVVAFVVDDQAEARPIEMRARYKRVREIIRASGYRVEEELYGAQIMEALRALRQ